MVSSWNPDHMRSWREGAGGTLGRHVLKGPAPPVAGGDDCQKKLSLFLEQISQQPTRHSTRFHMEFMHVRWPGSPPTPVRTPSRAQDLGPGNRPTVQHASSLEEEGHGAIPMGVSD